jgi:hypothetical protein
LKFGCASYDKAHLKLKLNVYLEQCLGHITKVELGWSVKIGVSASSNVGKSVGDDDGSDDIDYLGGTLAVIAPKKGKAESKTKGDTSDGDAGGSTSRTARSKNQGTTPTPKTEQVESKGSRHAVKQYNEVSASHAVLKEVMRTVNMAETNDGFSSLNETALQSLHDMVEKRFAPKTFALRSASHPSFHTRGEDGTVLTGEQLCSDGLEVGRKWQTLLQKLTSLKALVGACAKAVKDEDEHAIANAHVTSMCVGVVCPPLVHKVWTEVAAKRAAFEGDYARVSHLVDLSITSAPCSSSLHPLGDAQERSAMQKLVIESVLASLAAKEGLAHHLIPLARWLSKLDGDMKGVNGALLQLRWRRSEHRR